jgi:hypothetical protein
MRSIYHIGIIRLRNGQIICVSYLWIAVDGWQDGGVVVDLHLIMSHGQRRSVPQRSHQNVLMHFSSKREHKSTLERMTNEPHLGSSARFELDRVGAQFEVLEKNWSIRFPKLDGPVLVDSAFVGGARRRQR